MGSRSYSISATKKFTVNLVITLCVTALLVFIQFGIGFGALPERSQWTICTRWHDKESCAGGHLPKSEDKELKESKVFADKYPKTDGWPCRWDNSESHAFKLHRCTDPLCKQNY